MLEKEQKTTFKKSFNIAELHERAFGKKTRKNDKHDWYDDERDNDDDDVECCSYEN